MRPEDAKFADEYGGIAEQYAESANLSKRKCDLEIKSILPYHVYTKCQKYRRKLPLKFEHI